MQDWKADVIYQIYPASFCDTTGNGLGDISGITSKLDYLKELGITAIWVSPFYQSPQLDLGYDISSYQDVHEPYGTLADIEALISGCKARGLKILFDLVINHTSHQHKWFLESKKSRDNHFSDYYIWRDGRIDSDGKRREPNNWRSFFGGSVWTWVEDRQQYYLHLFGDFQPDLNWEDAEIRKAIYKEAIQFWSDRGIDGWRIDVVQMYSKHLDQLEQDVPITDSWTHYQAARHFFTNGPRLHEYLKEMNRECFAPHSALTIGELTSTPTFQDVLPFVADTEKELNMVLRFELHDLDHAGSIHYYPKKWHLPQFKAITEDSQKLCQPKYGAWSCHFLENHDQARSISRFASDAPEYWKEAGKMLAIYLLTLSGTPIIYQGQEIGMTNAKGWPIEEFKDDIETMNSWYEMQAAAKMNPEILVEGKRGIDLTSRAHSRTPMQWTNASQAGFSTNSKSWMRVNDNYKEINVHQQQSDPHSILPFYRRLLILRKEYQHLFIYGQFDMLDETNPSTFSFRKRSLDSTQTAIVHLNFSSSTQSCTIPEKSTLLISTSQEIGSQLKPYEGRVYLI